MRPFWISIQNPIIGDRAFGGNPTIVSKHGMATIAAMLDQYLIPCGKHFPGHGDTHSDSHKTLPVVDLATSRLTDRELRPFVHAIENRLTCVMTAHICCRAFDKELPASLSENIVTTLLRKTLKFQGVIVTDDLEMKGITDMFSVAEAAVKAVSVGSDLLLVCQTMEEQVATLEALHAAVTKGTITEARLDKSLGRLLFLKEHFILNRPKFNKAALQKMIGSDTHKRLVESINIRGRPRLGDVLNQHGRFPFLEFLALTALVFPSNGWHCSEKLPCQNKKFLENALSQLIENAP